MDSPPSRHGSSPPPSGAVGPRIFAFDGFEFDEERWELRDQGALVDVQPKVMQTIALLLRNRERVVSTEELVDALWPSVTVTEASLTKAIRIARQVLRDDGEAQRLIRTTRGRGYRFVGTVEERSANARLHAAPPLPVPGAGTDEPFVGRDLELGELLVALERARGGRSSFILVGGDPGVGKTSLVEAFAARAERTAVRVIWGRAWEEGGAPDLWPWIQILRGLLASGGALGPDDLGEVSRVLTMVLAGEQDGAPPRTGAERFRAFDAIVSVLSRAGRKAPLVLVLEDLHSADASTLTLTRFLVREIRDAGVFVLGTYRPSDLSVDPRVREPFKKLLSEARVVPLSGLGEDDTRRLMQAALGVPPDSRLFDRVRRVTEGNPLFIVEVTRRLAARTDGPARVDAEIGIPERIVEAVRARFDPLPKETRELLSAAAVIGRQFELPVLRRIVDTAEDPALLLEPAIVRGIIAEIPESLGTWAFSHMLLRDVLYDAFGIAQRAALHQRVGEVLETSGAPGVELPAARLAHHFLRAALGAGSEKAARYSAAAGRQALRSFAFEDAVRHFEHALEALHYASECEGQSMDLLLALAKAERLSGQYAQSRVTLDRALSLARAARDPIRVARVALDYGEVRPESGAPNPELLALLEEAAALLVDGTDASTAELRTLVDARLATCLAFAGRRDEAESRSARALESARSLGKPSLLGHALHCRHWVLWRPGTARERLTMATEMVALDGTSGEALPSMDGRLCEVTDLLELGEAGDFVRALARYERAAAALRDPSCLYNVCVFRTMRALLEGRFVDAERLAREAAMSGRRIHPENAQNFFSAHLWWTCIEQGRPMDLVSAFRERLARDRDNTLYRIALLRLLVEASDLGAAREELDIVARTDFARFPSDWALLPSLAHLATACFRLGDAPRARELRALLAPFVDSHVVLGPAIVYLGPASYYAALLSAVLGAYDDAESELEHALHAARRLGARPVVARVQLALGEILLRRGGADVPARAVVSGEAALSLSTELGMASVERRARALLEGLGVESAPRGS